MLMRAYNLITNKIYRNLNIISFTMVNFSKNTYISAESFKYHEKNENKHNKIVLFARNKLNSIENIITKTLIDNEVFS